MRAVVLAAMVATACGGQEGTAATIEVSLTQAPPDVACVRLTASGAAGARDFRFAYARGAQTVLSLAGLPAGEVVFSAAAFGTDCSQVGAATPRSWYAVPVSAQVPATGSIPLTLTFYR